MNLTICIVSTWNQCQKTSFLYIIIIMTDVFETSNGNPIAGSQVINPSSKSVADLKLSFFNGFFDTDPIQMSIDDIANLIKNDEDLKKLTDMHRTQRSISMDESRTASERKKANQNAKKSKEKFPIVIGGAVCEGGKKQDNVQYLIPIVAIDIDKQTPAKLEAVMAKIKADPYTVIAGHSPSGIGARAFIRIDNVEILQKLWDESPSKSAKTAMYVYMWNQVANYVEQTWDVAMDANCAQPVQAYSIAYDPDMYYNPEAEPFHIDMSGYVPARPGRKKSKVKGNDSVATDAKATTASELDKVIDVATRMVSAKGVYPADGRNTYLYNIASIANQYGVDQTDLTEWAIAEMEEEDFDADEISKCIASAYSHTDEHDTRQLSQSLMDEAEKILREAADFRFNQISQRMEIRYKKDAVLLADGKTWKHIQDRDLKTLYTKVKKCIKISENDVFAVIYAYDFATEYHALNEYLHNLPLQWDPSQPDYIFDLYSHLVLEDESVSQMTYPFFKLWFIRFVALGMGVIDRNQLVLSLIGKENIGKSYYFEQILPPELREYFQQIRPTDKFDRDLEILLSQKLLAYFDERSISSRDADAFKALVGGGTRSVRKPYGREPEVLVQRCTMGLSSNDQQYIGFREGTRRLISISIVGTKSFDAHPINYPGLYAQAYYEILQGNVKEQLSQQEVEQLKKINENFIVPDPCEDAILTYFEVPCATNHGKECWMTATEILSHVSSRSSDEINATTLGNALVRLGFKKKKISTWRYRVVKRDLSSNVVMTESDDFDYVEEQ